MVIVHFQISLTGNGNVHAAVAGKEVHHMVEESDARGAFKAAGAVDGKVDGNIGFPRFSVNGCLSHESSFLKKGIVHVLCGY